MNLPRGFRDYLPEDYELLEYIRDKFREVSSLYGFRLMEPSTIENVKTLEAKSGPSIRDEIYFFKDKGGREVGLRFDLTVGLTRYVCSRRDLAPPIKLASFADVWRYDEPQKARYRWFYQWDAEIYGPFGPIADCEVIALTVELFERLGLKDVIIKVGDRRLVQNLIEDFTGLKGDAVIELMRAIDKLDKKTPEKLIEEYVRSGIKEEYIREVLKLGEVEGSLDLILSKFGGGAVPEELVRLWELLECLGAKFIISTKVVRGLDYYTSIVFEAFYEKDPSIGALAGGGRYDVLTKIFGRPDLGATGVAGGVERTILALRGAGVSVKEDRPIYIGYLKGLEKEAFSILTRLRRSGVKAIVDLYGRSLERQLEESAKRRCKLSILLLPKEFENGFVVLKEMDRGLEEKVKVEELLEHIKCYI